MSTRPTTDDLALWLTIESPRPTDTETLLQEAVDVSVAWIEDRTAWDPANPNVPEQLRLAMLLTAARLYKRRNSASGFEGFGDLGFAPVRGMDTDVERLITRFIDWEFVMMQLSDIRQDLRQALHGVGSLQVYVNGESQPSLPAAVFQWPDEITYRQDLGGCGADITATVTILVPHGDTESAISALDRYLDSKGSESVIEALEGHAATSWQALTVVRAANWQIANEAGAFSVDIDLIIRT